jgi:hypothetical protein
MADTTEATPLAKGTVTADILTQADQQGMVFIEQHGIGGQIIHKKGLIGSVAITGRYQTNTVNDATSISVDNKNWLISRIQYYGIGSLLPNTVDREKLLAKLVRTNGKQPAEVIMTVFPQPVSQRLELACLGVIIATGVDKGSDFRQAKPTQRFG